MVVVLFTAVTFWRVVEPRIKRPLAKSEVSEKSDEPKIVVVPVLPT